MANPQALIQASHNRISPRLALLSLLGLLVGCVPRVVSPSVAASGAPTLLLGHFVDDYGIEYELSEGEWVQRPGSRYHIAKWVAGERYLVARNDSDNPSDANLWTRIDWVQLSGMEPYEWAFCLSAYAASSAAAAESTRVARPESPRTGCNGYPFSRMRRRE